MRLQLDLLQVYDLLVACGWMTGSHTSAPSGAAALRAEGAPGASVAPILKCNPLEGQIMTLGFGSGLQGFPGFHSGSLQL